MLIFGKASAIYLANVCLSTTECEVGLSTTEYEAGRCNSGFLLELEVVKRRHLS